MDDRECMRKVRQVARSSTTQLGRDNRQDCDWVRIWSSVYVLTQYQLLPCTLVVPTYRLGNSSIYKIQAKPRLEGEGGINSKSAAYRAERFFQQSVHILFTRFRWSVIKIEIGPHIGRRKDEELGEAGLEFSFIRIPIGAMNPRRGDMDLNDKTEERILRMIGEHLD